MNNYPKICSRCKRIVPRDNFGVDSRAKDGLKSTCNNCLCDERMERYWRDVDPGDSAQAQLIEKCMRKWKVGGL